MANEFNELPTSRGTHESQSIFRYSDIPDIGQPKATEVAANGAGASSARQTVYVDIGHCTSGEKNPLNGKRDTGFQSDQYTECQINTAVGRQLINELRNQGMRLVPTWNPDSPPPVVPKQEDLQRRNDVVNRDVALNCDDSIYVSIHHDNDPTKKGGQCAYIAEPKYNESLPLAQSIQNVAWKIRERASAPGCINSDTVTGNGKLVGLRGVDSVGVLIEGANVTNPEDKALMANPSFHQLEAKRIAHGISNYFKLRPGTERPYAACRRSF